jgi:DNA-binding CsgD family transcriptional regulator
MEDAARLTPMDQAEAWTARIVAAAEHRFNSGEVSRARDMLEELMPDLSAGPLRARARLQLARLLGDEPTVAIELLEAALTDTESDDRWRVEIESELGPVASNVGRLAAARAHAESAVRTAERLGDPVLVAKTLGHRVATLVCSGEPLQHDLLARLSTMEDSTAISTYHQPSTERGLALYWSDNLEAARPLLEQAAQRALSRGEEWDRLGVLLTLAHLEWDVGNQRLAEQHRQAAEEALGEFGEGVLWLVWLDARYALERGDLVLARTKAEHGLSLAERTGRKGQIAHMMPVLAAVDLLSGRPDAAHARLEQLRMSLASSGFGPAGAHAKALVWSQDVEALIAIGRLEDAEEVLAELRSRAEVSASPDVQALTSRSEGLLLAARGDLVAAIEAMDLALAAHAKRRRPIEQGRTLLEKGSLERRAKRKAAAKRTLEQALAMLEPLDAKIWVSRTRDELSRIGLRRARAAEGLTPAQHRVAELVASGLTNPEIARQLHMSLRTVESHLSRVYREHAVSSRSQLVAALAASHGLRAVS